MKLYHGSNVEVQIPKILTNVFCTEKALETLKFEGSYSL